PPDGHQGLPAGNRGQRGADQRGGQRSALGPPDPELWCRRVRVGEYPVAAVPVEPPRIPPGGQRPGQPPGHLLSPRFLNRANFSLRIIGMPAILATGRKKKEIPWKR